MMRILLLLSLLTPAAAWPGSALNPAPKILVLGDGNGQWQRVTMAMGVLSPAPQIVTCTSANASPPGILDELAGCGMTVAQALTTFCQIWDVRFNPGLSNDPPGTTSFDTITVKNGTAAIDTDQEFYEAHLANCGALMFLGENAEFPSRNEGLTACLSDWSNGGPVMYPYKSDLDNVLEWGPSQFGDGFGTILNTLNGTTTFYTDWSGMLRLDSMGSMRPLAYGTTPWQDQVTGITADMASIAGMKAADMKPGLTGRVGVIYDWQGFNNNAANGAALQNMYQWLGNCATCFTVAKVANPPAPTPVPLNTNYTYALCVNNKSATSPLPAGSMIFDTFPPCVTYQSHSPAVASSGPDANNFMTFSAPSIPALGYFCVTVTVRPTYLCP